MYNIDESKRQHIKNMYKDQIFNHYCSMIYWNTCLNIRRTLQMFITADVQKQVEIITTKVIKWQNQIGKEMQSVHVE